MGLGGGENEIRKNSYLTRRIRVGVTLVVAVTLFIVVVTGEIMTMPGLPKVPSSEKIFLNEQGYIEGLF